MGRGAMKKLSAAIAAAVLGITAYSHAGVSGVLFIGTDTEEFNGSSSNYLMKATVSGPNFVSQQNIPITYPLNGLGDGAGFLYSGDPNTNTLRTIDYNGNLLTS